MLDFGSYSSDYTGGYDLTQNVFGDTFGNSPVTVSPELSNDYNIPVVDFGGTTYQPAVAEIPRSDSGISVTGILQGVTSGAKSLLDIYGTYNQITSSVDNAKFQNEISAAKLDLQKAQTLGAIDVAKTQSAGNVAIEKARTQLAVANEVVKVQSGGGATASAGISLSMAVTIGLAIYALTKKGGK